MTRRVLNGGASGAGPRGTVSLRDVLGATLSKHRLQGGVSKARGIVLWPQVVGPELARLTHARTQQGSCLVVEVRDSSMAHFLTMQRATFLSMLQEKLGDQSVTELRFVVGRVRQKPAAPPPTPLPAPDQARAEQMARSVLSSVSGTVQPEQNVQLEQAQALHSAALRAAQAVTRARRWREQQGYAPCPVCGEPNLESGRAAGGEQAGKGHTGKAQPCRACALTLQEGLVVRASQRLQREPQALGALSAQLGDTGAQAARYLALGRLSEQLELLALECARAGKDAPYRDFLEQQARSYLQLHWQRTELVSADWQALPQQVRAALQP